MTNCTECDHYSRWAVYLTVQVPEFGIDFTVEKTFETEREAVSCRDRLRSRCCKANWVKWEGMCPKCENWSANNETDF